MTHYHVGSNIPGYSPDGEVMTFISCQSYGNSRPQSKHAT